MENCKSCGEHLDSHHYRYCPKCGQLTSKAKKVNMKPSWIIVIMIIVVLIGSIAGYLWAMSGTKKVLPYAPTSDVIYRNEQLVSQESNISYTKLGNVHLGRLRSSDVMSIYIVRESVKGISNNGIEFVLITGFRNNPTLKTLTERYIYQRGDSYLICVGSELIKTDNSVSNSSERIKTPVDTPLMPYVRAIEEAERTLGIR